MLHRGRRGALISAAVVARVTLAGVERLGRYQRLTMWVVGILLCAGFLADIIDRVFVQRPPEIHVLTELGWTLGFLLTTAAIEGLLWLGFRAYNAVNGGSSLRACSLRTRPL